MTTSNKQQRGQRDKHTQKSEAQQEEQQEAQKKGDVQIYDDNYS